jgi:hypothetical protein
MALVRHRDLGGRFWIRDATGDEGNVVILAAVVCIGEMARG